MDEQHSRYRQLSSMLSSLVAEVLMGNVGWVYSTRSVRLVRDVIQGWEDIVAGWGPGPSKNCHEQLIRLAKGQVKAWRIWLAER